MADPVKIDAPGGSSLPSDNVTGTGTPNTLAKFTAASVIGDSTVTDDGTIVTVNTASVFGATVANDNSRNFLAVTGTMPTTPSGSVSGVFLSITGAGSASQNCNALAVVYSSGYTGALGSRAITGSNNNAGTGTSLVTNVGNFGGLLQATGTTTGTNAGVSGVASGGNKSIGVSGLSIVNKSNATNIGGAFYASQTTGTPIVNGVVGAISATEITYVSAAALFDNAAVAVPILIARDNGAAVPTTGPTATVVIRDGAQLQAGNTVLTNGTMTAETQGEVRSTIHSYTWTNAMVTALGASLTGDVTICTLPAKTVVKNVYVVITGAATGTTTLTVSVGRTSASYIDYIVASDAQAAANTVYGDASGERGTNLTGYDLPSYTGTTDVVAHFISTGSNLSAVTGSTGRVIIETALVP